MSFFEGWSLLSCTCLPIHSWGINWGFIFSPSFLYFILLFVERHNWTSEIQLKNLLAYGWMMATRFRTRGGIWGKRRIRNILFRQRVYQTRDRGLENGRKNKRHAQSVSCRPPADISVVYFNKIFSDFSGVPSVFELWHWYRECLTKYFWQNLVIPILENSTSTTFWSF